MNDTYRWNPAEGIIGVVGVAPAATADFYQRLIALTPARKDWDHVRVLIDSNPKIPSRGRYLELNETDPTPFLRRFITDLADRGATVVAVPCNTAHILYDRYATGHAVPVPNMIDLAVEALRRQCRNVPQRVAVLGSRLTLAHDLYGRRLTSVGGGGLALGEIQTEVSACIELVKQGQDLGTAADRLRHAMQSCILNRADAFIVACTELSLLVRPEWTDLPVVDASTELARYCLDHAQGRSR